MFSLMHAANWKETICVPDGARNYIESGKTEPLPGYATEEMKEAWISRLRRDGFAAPYRWYKAMAYNHMWEHDKST